MVDSKSPDKFDLKNVLDFIASLHAAQNTQEATKGRKSRCWFIQDESSNIKMADLKFLGSVQLLDPFIHLISMILDIQNIHL